MKRPYHKKTRAAKDSPPKDRVRKAAPKDRPVLEMSLPSLLAVEANRLRFLLREISGRFLADLEAEVVRIVEMASDVPDSSKKQQALLGVVKRMQSLAVKPDKGRLNDLKRIRNLVQKVSGLLEDMVV